MDLVKLFQSQKLCLISVLLFSSLSVSAQLPHHTVPLVDKIEPSKSAICEPKVPAHTETKPLRIQEGNPVVELHVGYKWVNFSGKRRRAIAVNNQIPAPTLHFKEGDVVTLKVHNHLDKGTAIHWHGLLVPWQMDGVADVTQKEIKPGETFTYQFKLYQSGTYWYHAHAHIQEQDGLYGAFLIDSANPPPYPYDRDYVVVLSDWDNMGGEKIFSRIKKDGEYFSPRFPLQPSLMKFIHDYRKADPTERKKIRADYKMMQDMRMSIYDLSDVGYDNYLLNGQTKIHPWTAPVKMGEVVRLRFIGAAGSTIYQVKIPDAKMEMVQVQGNEVKRHLIENFSIAPGETYDVLVTIQKDVPHIIYAESIDTRGQTFGALVTNPSQRINYNEIVPFPEPLPVTMHHTIPGMSHGSSNASNAPEFSHDSHQRASLASHDHSMRMPTEAAIQGDQIVPPTQHLLQIMTQGTKYQNLIAATQTNDPHKPVDGVISMELFGYMEHFIWFINGLPEYRAKPILIEPDKRYRIIFTNNSMMRHPMHIHGHWFILRNGNDAFDPLLHTIEVPPGATAVADVDTDASGQWFFHCHHLYHMMSGMSRVFQYGSLIDVAKGSLKPESYAAPQAYINRPIIREDVTMPLISSLIKHPQGHHQGFYFANFLDIGVNPFDNLQKISFKGLYGREYNKIELTIEDAEIKDGKIENADMDIFYWHLVSQFWSIKGGANYFYRPAGPYWQPGIGIEGLMPYFIETNARSYFHNGSFKFDIDLTRDTQITNNFFMRAGIRGISATKTIPAEAIGSGLMEMRYSIRPYYRLIPGLSIFAEFEHEQSHGKLKNILQEEGESTHENSFTVGVSVIF